MSRDLSDQEGPVKKSVALCGRLPCVDRVGFRAMRSRARAVVVGGGVGGCSILYWLTRLGWDDVVLVERADLTSSVHDEMHRAGCAFVRLSD